MIAVVLGALSVDRRVDSLLTGIVDVIDDPPVSLSRCWPDLYARQPTGIAILLCSAGLMMRPIRS